MITILQLSFRDPVSHHAPVCCCLTVELFLLLGSRTFSNCLDVFLLYLSSTVCVSCIPTTRRESCVGNYTAGLKGLEQKHHTISLTFQVAASISIQPEVTGWIAQPCSHFNLIVCFLNCISICAPVWPRQLEGRVSRAVARWRSAVDNNANV